MSKYYVETGEVKGVIEASSPEKAAELVIAKAFKLKANLNVDYTILVNERGFIKDREDQYNLRDDDVVLSTLVIMDMLQNS